MSSISRRDLLKSAIIGGAGAALAGVTAAVPFAMGAEASGSASSTSGSASGSASSASAASGVATTAEFESSITWNGLYDVVVCGFGMAGEMSAITASENGAKVLVLEKAFDGLDGGDSRFCHQQSIYVKPEWEDAFRTYMHGLRGEFDNPTDAVIDTYVAGAMENRKWFDDRGLTTVSYEDRGEISANEHPEVEGGDVQCQDCFGIGEGVGDVAMFKYLKSQVVDDPNIDLWFQAPATALIQDPSTKAIIGVTATVGDQTVNIRARNGVILATGGYEASRTIMQDYVSIANPYPIAARFNTGDGQLMAAKVGAQLSAMHNAMMYINCLYSDGVTAEWNSGTRVGKKEYTTSLIYVGADGTRFMNENFKARHGYEYWHGNARKNVIPSPAWCVFDEAARLDTNFSWSMSVDQCAEAIAAGTVKKADTLEELADLIGVPSDNLVATVQQYNGFVEAGDDPEFHRSPDAMRALTDEGPFYAFQLVEAVLNTQGGPRRDENGQVIDVEGNPIPHLYGAGDCGELWTTLYQGSGNVGGCLIWGRVSGANAAAVKDDAQPADDLAIDTFTPTVEEPTFEAGENQLVGSADSHCGTIVLRATMDGDTISACEVLQCYDSVNIGLKAVNQYAQQVVGMTLADVANVDTITHATDSCNSFKAAIASME